MKGEVILDLDGEELELRPTLKAYQKIQTRFGGLRGALEAAQLLNIDHISHIVCAGANISRKEEERIKEAVFNEGVANVTEQIVPFLTALMDPNGGSDEEEVEKKPSKATD